MEVELDEHIKIGFYTATILDWKKLLKPDKYKEIILGSLRFLAEEQRATVYGFVIMPNHLHLLWKIENQWHLEEVQRDYEGYRANDQVRFKSKASKCIEIILCRGKR